MSIAEVALVHRRTLAECRARPYLTATLKKMERLTEGGKVPLMPERSWPWQLALARIKRNDKKGKKCPLHHTIVSNQAVSDVAKLTVPAPGTSGPGSAARSRGSSSDADSERTAAAGGATTPPKAAAAAASEGKEGSAPVDLEKQALHAPAESTPRDLPLLAYYMRITAPIQDHQAYRFQTNEKGLFMEGSMRRRRWANIAKAVEQLEREYGHGKSA